MTYGEFTVETKLNTPLHYEDWRKIYKNRVPKMSKKECLKYYKNKLKKVWRELGIVA